VVKENICNLIADDNTLYVCSSDITHRIDNDLVCVGILTMAWLRILSGNFSLDWQ